MRCPRCGGDDARLLGTLNPGVIFECLGCGEVWKAVFENDKPRRRRVGRTKWKGVLFRNVKITPADLEALKRLRRISLKRCRSGLRRLSIAVKNPTPLADHWSNTEVHKDG